MTPTATGRLVPTGPGRDLVLRRTLPVAIADVWAAFTQPEITGRWFATWTGEARAGTRVRATLTGEEGGDTELAFVQHLEDDTDIGSIGPGWEYYLDRLASVLVGGPEPSFEDYYPAQQGYYETL